MCPQFCENGAKIRNINLGRQRARVPQEEASAGRGKEKEADRRGGGIIENIYIVFYKNANFQV